MTDCNNSIKPPINTNSFLIRSQGSCYLIHGYTYIPSLVDVSMGDVVTPLATVGKSTHWLIFNPQRPDTG
ncbi:hypothetical protein [Calothrix sp. UHCC 0171]|uniref:hypothetical protein n=1 Tax=Calothrix sp. UHCC 0171 TaxID=3110245 RepID=UPI002B2109BD|nr:hypothetical protein [Calothrix sp. UHCC 0171]MEA5570224.1 hypothetical protein [Calothrix sp. UHCC 0171]